MAKHYERTQILLDPEQRIALARIADEEGRSFSDVARGMIQEQLRLRQKQQLARAAEILLPDYTTDGELAAFRSLDGEDFANA
jgi:hypothetical protein